MSTAVNLFVRQTVRLGGIPFPITTGGDPFYSEAHQRYLRKTIAELESGKAKLVAKTEDELRAMADG
jgi:DNA-damage-inducible protein J